MTMGLVDGRVALVTGGGRGIGRATAELLAREGAKVAVADVDLSSAEDVVRGIEARGGEGLALQVDVSDPEQIGPMFERVVFRFGRLDVLHNNAGVFSKTPIDELSAEQWDRLMSVNLRGAFLVAQYALRLMQHQGGGRIINMGSMGGQVGGVVAGADYSASKAAIACLTKSMAKWGGPHGILVNTLNPGVIDTAMPAQFPPDRRQAMIEATPLRRMGTAEEVASVVLFLASDLSSFVTGTHIDINGGLHTD
ncbi:MAG: SDR family oxidoreductase [Chloroflexi bacterium]|nr:SDR family oxidoreductase [Chloroflexota bacterium]